MAKRKIKGDVSWIVPKKKKPIAYSTVATSHLIGLLSQEHKTIQDVYDAVTYDVEAKEILQKYIDLGYGNEIAKQWFRYQKYNCTWRDFAVECKVTCFERVMHLVEELPKDKYKEAVEIIQEYSFEEFLMFCVDNGCFTKEQSSTLYDGIIMWEDLDGNYWEEDYDRLYELFDKVGITEEVFTQFAE